MLKYKTELAIRSDAEMSETRKLMLFACMCFVVFSVIAVLVAIAFVF